MKNFLLMSIVILMNASTIFAMDEDKISECHQGNQATQEAFNSFNQEVAELDNVLDLSKLENQMLSMKLYDSAYSKALLDTTVTCEDLTAVLKQTTNEIQTEIDSRS